MSLIDGTTSIDQPVSGGEIVLREEGIVLSLVDRVLGQALEEENLDIAWLAMEKFRAMNKASSLAACKLLHGIGERWKDFDNEGETFVQQAVRKTGYSQATVERYVSVWEFLNGPWIPSEFRTNIWNHTMRQLVKEASLVVDQEYELSHDDWRDLSEAADDQRVAEVCSRVKGTERNKNHMSLKIDEDGTLIAYQGKNQRAIGQLFITSEDDLTKKAIKRIMDSSGITKRSDY